MQGWPRVTRYADMLGSLGHTLGVCEAKHVTTGKTKVDCRLSTEQRDERRRPDTWKYDLRTLTQLSLSPRRHVDMLHSKNT